MAAKLRSVRRIFKELRYIADGLHRSQRLAWRSMPVYNQIVDNFRTLKESTNEEKIKESLFEAELYMNHLESIRKERELQILYKGVGERSIEEMASTVGLKLPEKYKETNGS